MGDLSQLIPAIHPYTGGATGPGHSKTYLITDYDVAVINPAKIMAMSVIDLLFDGAKQAKGSQISPQGCHVARCVPAFSARPGNVGALRRRRVVGESQSRKWRCN